MQVASFQPGDLVQCHERALLRVTQAEPLRGWRTTKDGLLLDLRCTERHIEAESTRRYCLSCGGQHHIQSCPDVQARLLRVEG